MVAHRDVRPDSLKKYGLIVTCLLCFVFRCFEGWDCGYSMELTPEQKQACQNLKDVLAEIPENDVEDGIEFDYDALDDIELEPEDFDDEDEGGDEGELELERGSGMERQLTLIENPVQRCVLDLLVSLFTHLPSGTDGKFYTPIYRFLVLFSLKKSGQWLAGRRITQLFAAVLFCGRQVIMALMHQRIIESAGLRYSECVSIMESGYCLKGIFFWQGLQRGLVLP
jgi:hypothetical protein